MNPYDKEYNEEEGLWWVTYDGQWLAGFTEEKDADILLSHLNRE